MCVRVCVVCEGETTKENILLLPLGLSQQLRPGSVCPFLEALNVEQVQEHQNAINWKNTLHIFHRTNH